MLSKIRQPVSSLTHLAGALCAIVGLVVLLPLGANRPNATAAISVYGASLFLLFAASGIYHWVNASPRAIRVLRKIDHSAIYLLIAGTYTPFCVLAFHGFWSWGLLAIIWTLAVVGIGVKIFFIQAPRWVTAGVYVVMGWLIILALPEMLASLPPAAIGWMVAGGVIYTAGAVVYSTRRMDFIPDVFGFHEVWHIFVMLGAAAHFIAVYAMLVGLRGM